MTQINTHAVQRRFSGFTLIELMIVIAVIAIILTLALPVYSQYSIRAKIGEGLSTANAATTAVASTCQENPNLINLNDNSVGYAFDSTPYVTDINVSGDCHSPVITILTQNTGASPNPILTITGTLSSNDGVMTWVCTADAPNYLVPKTCRS